MEERMNAKLDAKLRNLKSSFDELDPQYREDAFTFLEGLFDASHKFMVAPNAFHDPEPTPPKRKLSQNVQFIITYEDERQPPRRVIDVSKETKAECPNCRYIITLK